MRRTRRVVIPYKLTECSFRHGQQIVRRHSDGSMTARTNRATANARIKTRRAVSHGDERGDAALRRNIHDNARHPRVGGVGAGRTQRDRVQRRAAQAFVGLGTTNRRLSPPGVMSSVSTRADQRLTLYSFSRSVGGKGLIGSPPLSYTSRLAKVAIPDEDQHTADFVAVIGQDDSLVRYRIGDAGRRWRGVNCEVNSRTAASAAPYDPRRIDLIDQHVTTVEVRIVQERQ